MNSLNNIEIDISESVYDMTKDHVNLLYSWQWERLYFMDYDTTFWIYEIGY